jgi:hypothetical protein
LENLNQFNLLIFLLKKSGIIGHLTYNFVMLSGQQNKIYGEDGSGNYNTVNQNQYNRQLVFTATYRKSKITKSKKSRRC